MKIAALVVALLVTGLLAFRFSFGAQAFPPAEVWHIPRRLEFHYTPKHASWLNMVEIERR